MRTHSTTQRRHDLDWLRAAAILLVIVFHSIMPFEADSQWHIVNAERSDLLSEVAYFLSRWRMALLFLIAGAGTAWALGRRPAATYLRERARRLLVPLALGIFVIVPPQIYVERLAGGATYASYLEFYGTVFEFVAYPRGSFSWHHLWFLAYLFLYSLLALPLLVWLRGGDRRARLDAALARLLRGPGLYLLAAPMALALIFIYPRFPGPQDVISDWGMFTYYLSYFVIGALIADATEVWRQLEERRAVSLRIALLCLIAVNYLRWNDLNPGMHAPRFPPYAALVAVHAWAWVVTILGYGRRHLSFSNRVLDWTRDASYPVYVLHQTVIVVIAFYVVQVQESVLAKFVFLFGVSLVLTVALYETLIRPFPAARFLFGLKTQPARGTRIAASPVRPVEAPALATEAPTAAPPRVAEPVSA